MTTTFNWEKIWNKREFNESKIYEYNGYIFENEDKYYKFIFELTKNIPIKNNQKILDVGCGNGSFIDRILKNNNIESYNLTGIDFCKKNIDYANRYFNGNFINNDIKETFPFEDKCFDVIICISTLFYLTDEIELQQVLNEIKRVSKDNSIIFLGNCMDFDKKILSQEIREKTHILESTHLYIKKVDIVKLFKQHKITITDLDDLDLDFYTGQKYKFNILIENVPKKNIGIDFHDTLSYNPEFFKSLVNSWNGKVIIITGTPFSEKKKIEQQLNNLGFFENIHYDNICCGYEYKKEEMDYSHFEKMKKHKLKMIKDNNIKIYFDDNPFYVNYLKDYDINVYQTILSSNYINKFKQIDKYFCCNLQENQFNFLETCSEKVRVYIPGVFDLFHIGHLKLINNFVNKNNFIIIGVHDDSSVYNSKSKYPVLNIDERMSFIKELSFVDRVISYKNTDQSKLLGDLNINIFVIGPDFGYTTEHKNTIDFCKENNIKIVTTKRTENISTTEVIEKIKSYILIQ